MVSHPIGLVVIANWIGAIDARVSQWERSKKMSYFKKMTGDKVYLSPVNVDDYEKYTKWVND
jgi:hypothetical protein